MKGREIQKKLLLSQPISKSKDKLLVLGAMGRVLAGKTSLFLKQHVLLQGICLFGYDQANMWFFDENTLILLGNSKVRLHPSQSLFGRALKENNVVTMNLEPIKVKAPARWKNLRADNTKHYQSLACAPIIWQGRPLGILSIASFAKKSYKEEDLNIIKIFAFLAGPLLFEEAQLRYSTIELIPSITAIELIRKLRSNQVLVLGKDSGPELAIMQSIQDSLKRRGLTGIIVKDQPEIPELSNEEKTRILAGLSRFVICEDSYPAGQISELKMCATNRIPTAILREKGKGSTWMISDYPFDFNFIEVFTYSKNKSKSLNKAVDSAIIWATRLLKQKSEYLNKLYPWRNNRSKRD